MIGDESARIPDIKTGEIQAYPTWRVTIALVIPLVKDTGWPSLIDPRP